MGIIYLTLKYAIFMIMPFLIGFLIAAFLNPVVRFLALKFDMKRKPLAVMILLLFLATVGMLITIAVVQFVVWAGEFSSALPALYAEKLAPLMDGAFAWVSGIIARFEGASGGGFTENIGEFFKAMRTSLGNAVSELSVQALAHISAFAARIPRFVVELVFAVISAFFFIVDFEELLSLVKFALPKRTVTFLRELREHFCATVARYIRSYALILVITFAELTVGFLFLRVEHAFSVAALVAFADLLPLIGCGGILLPWALFCLVSGNIGRAVGFVILWAVIALVRNIMEPRIVGKQMGIHPLLTLTAMFVGTKLFGFAGLILLPLLLSVVISIWRASVHPASEKAV